MSHFVRILEGTSRGNGSPMGLSPAVTLPLHLSQEQAFFSCVGEIRTAFICLAFLSLCLTVCVVW
jgi:hypothetical protein